MMPYFNYLREMSETATVSMTNLTHGEWVILVIPFQGSAHPTMVPMVRVVGNSPEECIRQAFLKLNPISKTRSA